MNADIRVIKKNEIELKVETNSIISNEINEYFSAMLPNARFHPKVKMGVWDGKMRFFSRGKIPIGLYQHLEKFAKLGRYSIEKNFNNEKEVDIKDLEKFVQYLEITKEPRDYQLQAVLDILTSTKGCLEMPTSSGKCIFSEILELEVSDEIYEKYFSDYKIL